MPITLNALTRGESTTDATSYTTASISPTANALVLVVTCSRRSGAVPSSPTITGGGMTTWTLNNAATVGTPSFIRISGHRSLQASPGSGTLTINWGAETQLGCCWSVFEFLNVLTTGINGADAMRNPATGSSNSNTLTITLGAFGDANNGTLGAFQTIVGGVDRWTTAGAGFSQIDFLPAGGETNNLATEWRNDNDTTVDATRSGGLAINVGFGAEIVFAAGAVDLGYPVPKYYPDMIPHYFIPSMKAY